MKPGFGHPKTAQLSTEQRRELVLMQMKRVDAQLAASVRQKQMLLEALRRRTQSRPEHTGSAPTQRSSENPSASTSAAPLVVAPSASASAVDIFRIAGGQKTPLSSLSTTTSAAAAAPLERSNVLRLADHLLQQLRAVVRVSQQRLLLLNAPHKSQYAAVQTAAEIVDQINAQLREFNVRAQCCWTRMRTEQLNGLLFSGATIQYFEIFYNLFYSSLQCTTYRTCYAVVSVRHLWR